MLRPRISSVIVFCRCLPAMVLACAISTYAPAQSPPQLDSLRAALPAARQDTARSAILRAMAKSWLLVAPDSGIALAAQAVAVAEAAGWDVGLAQAHVVWGDLYRFQNATDSAMAHYEAAQPLLVRAQEAKSLAQLYYAMGDVCVFASRYDEALRYGFASLRIAESRSYPRAAENAYVLVGKVYGRQQDYPKAISYLKQGVRLLRQNPTPAKPRNLAIALQNLGDIYAQANRPQEAIATTQESVDLSFSIGDTVTAYSTMAQVAMFYSQADQSDSALLLINRVFNGLQALGVTDTDPYNYISRASILTSMVKKQRCVPCAAQALRDIDSARAILRQHPDVFYETDLAKLSVTLQKLRGNYQAALDAYEQYVALKDSVYTLESHKAIEELSAVRALSAKDGELARNGADLDRAALTRRWLIGGIALALLAIAIVWRQSALRRRANKTLAAANRELDEANRVKARFFGILSHDLRQPVANLTNYLYLLREAPGAMDADTRERNQARIGTATQNLLTVMEDLLLWSKSQMSSFRPSFSTVRVMELFDDIRKLLPDTATDVVFNAPGLLTIQTDENFLKTIMRNLTSNALQALSRQPGGRIEWRAWEADGQQYLSCTDNGPGLSEDALNRLYDESAVTSASTGLGLHLVRDFARMLHYRLDVRSKAGEGTTFVLSRAA